MSLVSALSNSLNTLQTIQQGMSVIANNVSNAQTEGYTRKYANLESVLLGSDFGGVRVRDYGRVVDTSVYNSLLDSAADNGLYGTQNKYLQELQQLFGSATDQATLSTKIEEFINAWRKFETSPDSSAVEREVIQRGVDLTAEISRIANGVEELDRDARQEMDDSVDEINDILEQIDTINEQISAAQSRNQPTGDLEDERDRKLRELSGYMEIKTFPRDAGAIAVYTTNGYSLLDGTPRAFAFDGTDITVSGSSTAITSYFSGGKIESLHEIRAAGSTSSEAHHGIIDKVRDQLEALADHFLSTSAGTFTATYNAATTGSGELGSGFFTGTSTDANNAITIAVNANLLDSSNKVKRMAAPTVVDSLILSTRSFSAGNLSLTNVNYTDMAENIVGTLNQQARTVKESSDLAEQQQNYFSERYQNTVGVNLDTELVQLQVLQRSYQAAARLVSVINEMYEITLEVIR
ncbi:MAG: flagellar hook-associated protein FlgK [Alphaproteobacteria bacterium]|nr:flagellar hook-associated protein FlgK [Alphaproteobacteria bacterium]